MRRSGRGRASIVVVSVVALGVAACGGSRAVVDERSPDVGEPPPSLAQPYGKAAIVVPTLAEAEAALHRSFVQPDPDLGLPVLVVVDGLWRNGITAVYASPFGGRVLIQETFGINGATFQAGFERELGRDGVASPALGSDGRPVPRADELVPAPAGATVFTRVALPGGDAMATTGPNGPALTMVVRDVLVDISGPVTEPQLEAVARGLAARR